MPPSYPTHTFASNPEKSWHQTKVAKRLGKSEEVEAWRLGEILSDCGRPQEKRQGHSHSHRMPEGPELHLASHFVNEACRGLVFGGCVEKSSVSRNPEVPFESSAYHISASARGKELRLTLSPLPGAQPPQEPLALIFRFGMSGSFQLAPADALPPHAHLRFYTAPPAPRLALCFVDIRRFGHWDPGGKWQPGRGPCVLLEYEQFRLRIPPFEKARTVLEALQHHRPSPEMTLSQKIRAKLQNPDLLELCHSVPKEVVQLGGKGYGPEHGEEDFAAFRAWLRCYGMPGMSSLRDRHGRTIWFQGDPGPLAPKGGKSRKKKSQETQLQPKEKLEDLPPPNKAPSRTPRARRHLPKKTAIQQPEGTSLQQDLKAPTVPEKGRRKGKQATTGGLSSASSGEGRGPLESVSSGSNGMAMQEYANRDGRHWDQPGLLV
ncbi:nei like DNA glycosylase 1, transcript variant X3 [Ictidomys tridecemlineatus]|uniref:endonuclease 8-like 1 isoform X3 n=1 Tax=Ictidomys tridecemlineatus TaxID=43179 RepID=UPI000B539B53|nr:endonuclease 8-like 1 isoform X3 [Ictidomys tridecemlineatus]KAG3262322.1 nei like DNA glycosylase 1, transcript variant X3 [Ictidomys tridecemlineatus]